MSTPFMSPDSIVAIATRRGRPDLKISVNQTLDGRYAARPRGVRGRSVVADSPEAAVERCIGVYGFLEWNVKQVIFRYPHDYKVTLTDSGVEVDWKKRDVPLREEDQKVMQGHHWLWVCDHVAGILDNHALGKGEPVSYWLRDFDVYRGQRSA